MAESETHEQGASVTQSTDTTTQVNAPASVEPSPVEEAPEGAVAAKADAQGKQPRRGVSPYVWAAGIFLLLAGELYIYGHNGQVRVCVGRKGLTDFAQLDKPRKGNIASGYPFCVESLNLGMYSRSEDVAKEALDVACGRAATLLRGEKSECIRRDKDWSRQVDKKTIPPWDPRLYRRLFFIE